MLSLDNTFNENEVLEWDDRLERVLGLSEFKLCGGAQNRCVSLSVVYEKRAPVRGVTRAMATTAKTSRPMCAPPLVPLKLQPPTRKFLDVRGEVFMDKRISRGITPRRKSAAMKPCQSAQRRRRLAPPEGSAVTADRPLRFIAHSFGVFRRTDMGQSLRFPESLRRDGIADAAADAALRHDHGMHAPLPVLGARARQP